MLKHLFLLELETSLNNWSKTLEEWSLILTGVILNIHPNES